MTVVPPAAAELTANVFQNRIYCVRGMIKECKKANIDFHPPDSFIIADFHKNGINKIYSNNNHFLDACRLFGMDTSKLKTDEKEIERQMREIFRKRRK